MPNAPKRQIVEAPPTLLFLLLAIGFGLSVIVMAGIWFAFFRH
jgi:hypothetical protein